MGLPVITPALLKKTLPLCTNPDVWAPALDAACQKYGITSTARIASFLAQTGYESGQFNKLAENLNYSTAARLVKVWPKRFANEAFAAPYVNNPQKLANCVYANRMGNGPPNSGDGYLYRGRGIIQITGRSNYEAASKALGVDLIQNPDLLMQPANAALSAAWFWSTNGLNALADDQTDDHDLEDFTQITKRINGGTSGLQARLALLNAIAAQLA